MKLRNKKTGEIVEFRYLQPDHVAPLVLTTYENDKPEMYAYNSLAELNAEWEDYEEPKEYWYINASGDVNLICEDDENPEDTEASRQIGNYFLSREEAELAVRKLKAWKRLKDKGFRFTGINDDEDSQELITQCGILCEADIYHLAKDEDFLLLFGGEE